MGELGPIDRTQGMNEAKGIGLGHTSQPGSLDAASKAAKEAVSGKEPSKLKPSSNQQTDSTFKRRGSLPGNPQNYSAHFMNAKLQKSSRRVKTSTVNPTTASSPTLKQNLESTVSKYQIPLSLDPPKPENGVNNIHTPEGSKRKEAYIAASPEESQEAIKAMLDEVECVTFEKFEKALKETVTDLNSQIPKDQDYVILVRKKKSNKWVAELALPHLTKLPKDAIDLDNLETYLEEHPEVKNVVLFDDASYSGEQMTRFVQDKAVGAFEARQMTDFTVHVAAPYMTKVAKGKISAVNQNSTTGGNVTICQHKEMKTAAERIPEKHQRVLLKTYLPFDLSHDLVLLFAEEFQGKREEVGKEPIEIDYSIKEVIDLERESFKHNDAIVKLQEKINNLLMTQIKESGSITGLQLLFLLSEDPEALQLSGEIMKEAVSIANTHKKSSDTAEDLLNDLSESYATFTEGWNSRTLTVFDHKVADHLSIVPGFDEGVTADGKTEASLFLEPEGIYKSNY